MPLMNPALRDTWAQKSRYKVLIGGRGSSKSHDACGRLTYLTNKYKIKVMAVRQFQNRITDSVYTLLKNKIEAFGYQDNFTILNNSIRNKTGSEFLFYGINRNITEIKSTEDVDILYIEEAHALTKEQWDVLKPTIRKNNSEIWILFNPDLDTDFSYERFVINPPKNAVVRHINYDENPFCSQTFLEEVEEAKEEDYDDYCHVYLGQPKAEDNQAIIKRSWLRSCVDSHIVLNIEPTGRKVIGFDVADGGEDKCCEVSRHGVLTYRMEQWNSEEDELDISCRKVYNKALEDDAIINYDSVGVGSGSGSHFKLFNKESKKTVKYHKFDAGAGVDKPEYIYKDQIKNKDAFANLKAQAWYYFANLVKNTHAAVVKGKDFDENEIISLSSDLDGLEELIKELSIPKKWENTTLKMMVEPKKELAKRGIPSPNRADAIIMAYYIKKSSSFFG